MCSSLTRRDTASSSPSFPLPFLLLPFFFSLVGGDGTNTYDFYLNFCGAVGGLNAEAACKDSIACQVWGAGAGSDASLGLVSKVTYDKIVGFQGVKVIATGGTDYRNYEMNMYCPSGKKPEQDSPCYFGEVVADNKYIFEWSNPIACPGAGGGGGEGFLLFLLIATLSYLAIGIAFMYFAKGARGIEVIPNLAFWQEFPSLVRDGCRFTVAKVKGLAGRGGATEYSEV